MARSPADLVALVPVVLGFHPGDSVVLLTLGSPGRAFHARVDLPVTVAGQEEVATVLVEAVRTNAVRGAAVLLYTDDDALAEAQGEILRGRLLECGVEVLDVLRVDEECWHRVPADGTPGTAYDLDTHPFTAQRVFEGRVVHRDRAELADTLVGTDEEDAVEVALAAARYAGLVERSHEAGLLASEARWLQRFVRSYEEEAGPVPPPEAGRLLVLASLLPTRDAAWAEITRASSARHVELWRGLVRRAPSQLLPGACSLLAFAAWQQGDGALAWCALDRCLEHDPDYAMAHTVAAVLTGAVSPDTWVPPREDELPVFAGRRLRSVPTDRAF